VIGSVWSVRKVTNTFSTANRTVVQTAWNAPSLIYYGQCDMGCAWCVACCVFRRSVLLYRLVLVRSRGKKDEISLLMGNGIRFDYYQRESGPSCRSWYSRPNDTADVSTLLFHHQPSPSLRSHDACEPTFLLPSPSVRFRPPPPRIQKEIAGPKTR